MSADVEEAVDINDLPVLEIAAKVVEHNDYLVRIDALLNGDERVMGKLARAVIALAEENATLRECAANAADVLEARTDKPQRMVAAGFVRRQLDATTRDKSGRGK